MLDIGDCVAERGCVAGPLLADGERGGVLEVSAADLHDRVPLAGLLVQGLLQALESRDGLLDRHLVGGDVHRSREGVVGGLPHVHVIIRVDGLLRAERAADELDASIRHDLIHVHVRLRARPGLPHVQREVEVEGAADDLIADSLDELALPRREAVVAGIDDCCSLLHVAVRVIDLVRHAVMADVEVDEASLRLGAPVAIGRHHHGAKAVKFLALPRALQANRQVENLRRLFFVRHGGLRQKTVNLSLAT